MGVVPSILWTSTIHTNIPDPCFGGSLEVEYLSEAAVTAIEKMRKNGLSIDDRIIYDIASKYNLKELSVFGSSIRDDFTDSSDVDLVIVFKNSREISLFDLMDIQEFFESKFARKVDLVEPDGLRNPIRRKAIMESKEILYVA